MKKITTLTEVKQQTASFGTDNIRLDKLMIEVCLCPNCRRPFKYLGVSNSTEYRAYGICEDCDLAKLYSVERCELKEFKQQFEQAVQAV